MAFGDPIGDIGGYGQGFGGPNDPDDEKGWNLINLGQANQPVTWGSALASELFAPSMVDSFLDGPVMNDPEKMGPWSRGVYNTLDFINDPTQIVDPVYNFVDKNIVTPATDYLGNVIDLDPETLVNTVVNSTIGQSLGAPLKTIGDTAFSLLEAGGFNPQMDTSNYGQGQGVFAEPNPTPAVEMGIDDSMEQNPIMDFADPIGLMADPLGVNLSFNNRVSTKELPAEVKMYGPPAYMDLNFYGIPNPAFDPDTIKNNPQDTWDAIDNMFDPLSSLDDAVFDLDNAIASIGPNAFESAFGTGYSGVSPDMGAVSQEGGGELQEALAQRAAETIIAQQAARQVTPQSNKVTIPTSSGPNIVIDVTPPAPQTRVAPHRRTAPKPSPVKVAAKSITKPKAFKALPKFAQKELRQGKVPTGGSDNVQDMVRAFLGGQEAFGDSGTRK